MGSLSSYVIHRLIIIMVRIRILKPISGTRNIRMCTYSLSTGSQLNQSIRCCTIRIFLSRSSKLWRFRVWGRRGILGLSNLFFIMAPRRLRNFIGFFFCREGSSTNKWPSIQPCGTKSAIFSPSSSISVVKYQSISALMEILSTLRRSFNSAIAMLSNVL